MGSLKKGLRGVFSIRRHLIMRLDLGVCQSDEVRTDCKLLKANQITDLIDGTYTTEVQRKIIDSNPGLVETFILKHGGESVGILSVMYRGGNELEYKIRNIDAFVYNVMVLPAFRGKGYAGIMIDLLSSKLKQEGIKEIYLAVSTDNTSAIRAYQKKGFSIIGRKHFVRTMKHNIPYYVL